MRQYRRFRRGNTLVLFVMMVFGIMAIAGLAIDMGLVSLTRREMQTAVNTAALEGLRDGAQSASDMVSEVFTDPAQQVQFGPGPNVTFEPGGISIDGSNYVASQYMPKSGWSVWQLPQPLDINSSNEQDGDIVTGKYQVDATSHAEKGIMDGDPYHRDDFTPSSPSDPTTDAMLVRMRRSTESQNGSLSAGATGGPPVPMLFSRGAALLLYDGNPLLENGVTVRATAIAKWTPVVSIRFGTFGVCFADPTAIANGVGLSQLPSLSQLPNQTALQTFALTDQFWLAPTDQDVTNGTTPIWTTPPSQAGEIYQTASVSLSDSMTAKFTSPGSDPQSGPTSQAAFSTTGATTPVIVGQSVGQSVTKGGQLPQTQVGQEGCVPIIETSTGQNMIIGFAYVWCFVPDASAPTQLTVSRYFRRSLPGYTSSLTQNGMTTPPVYVTHAVQNASASFSAIAISDTNTLLQGADVSTAMQHRSTLVTDPNSALYLLSAPALVRTMP